MSSGEFATVAPSFIWVDRAKRQRRTLLNVTELAHSIQLTGLINPPVIKRDGELVAGERRWEAVKSLGWTAMAVQWVDELDNTALQILELEENIQRVNLTWQDECRAILEYHTLRMKHDHTWTAAQSAIEIGQSKQTILEKIQVARELIKGTERVAEAPKYSTAKGIMIRTNERAAASAITKALSNVSGPKEEAPAQPAIPILHADFHDWVETYSGPLINFLHCDFPYGVNAGEHHQGQAASQGGYEDTFQVYEELLITLKEQMLSDKLIAPSAHLMFWFSMDYYQYTFDALTEMGWKVDKFPLVWHKTDNTGILPDPARGGRRIYETAFMASRGDRKIVRAKSNACGWPGKDKEIHMSEKPVGMLNHFFQMFVDNYSIMLDPTCGSGNSMKAAQALGAHSVLGLEADEEFYLRAKEAFENEQQQRS